MKEWVPGDWSDLGQYEPVLVEEIARLEELLTGIAGATDGPRLLMAEKYREMIQNRKDLLNMIRARAVAVAAGKFSSAA